MLKLKHLKNTIIETGIIPIRSQYYFLFISWMVFCFLLSIFALLGCEKEIFISFDPILNWRLIRLHSNRISRLTGIYFIPVCTIIAWVMLLVLLLNFFGVDIGQVKIISHFWSQRYHIVYVYSICISCAQSFDSRSMIVRCYIFTNTIIIQYKHARKTRRDDDSFFCTLLIPLMRSLSLALSF